MGNRNDSTSTESLLMSDERPIPKNMPEDPKERWEKAREMAASNEGAYCRGWIFPRDPSRRDFEGVTFRGITCFEGATFEGPVRFIQATFKGSAFFNEITFNSAANFYGANFEASVNFDKVSFCGANFKGANFGPTCFDGSTFDGFVDFDYAKFNYSYCSFERTIFSKRTSFENSYFQCGASFEEAIFIGDVVFSRAFIAEELAWFGVRCDRNLDLGWQSTFKNNLATFTSCQTGERLFRFAKITAENKGDLSRAGVYHFAEQCARNEGRRKEAKDWTKEWFAAILFDFGIGRLIFGYGEKPERPAIASLVIILLCAIIYCLAGNLGDSGIMEQVDDQFVTITSLKTSLYFSVVTFTTLGYGDMQPTGLMRLVAGFEALCGAGLMAAFVVVLSRKFVR